MTREKKLEGLLREASVYVAAYRHVNYNLLNRINAEREVEA